MRKAWAVVLAALIVALPLASIAAAGNVLYDNWAGYPAYQPWPEGSTHGPWRDVFNGYGTTEVIPAAQPGSATHALYQSCPNNGVDHSCLVVTNTSYGDMTEWLYIDEYSPGVYPWETGWVLWHYTDNAHFYDLILKSNGWEVDQENPAYPDGQRFIASGSTPTFGSSWYLVGIKQQGAAITVWAGGVQLVSFTDPAPYLAGSAGFYTESASTLFGGVSVDSP